MTLAQINDYRRYADKWKATHESARIIAKLCDEIERLRGIADERTAAYSDFSLMPFGVYQRTHTKLGDVPDSYFRWWLTQNPDRGIIQLESNYSSYPKKAAAQQKLKLFDYIQRRFNNGR